MNVRTDVVNLRVGLKVVEEHSTGDKEIGSKTGVGRGRGQPKKSSQVNTEQASKGVGKVLVVTNLNMRT
jgi:hypothetical protein